MGNTMTIKHGAAAPTVNQLSFYEFGYSSNEDDIYLKVDKDGKTILRSEKGIINQLISSSLSPIVRDIANIKSNIGTFDQRFSTIEDDIEKITGEEEGLPYLKNYVDGKFANGFILNNAASNNANTIGKILAKDSNGNERDLIYRNSNNAVVVGDQQPGSTAGNLYLGVGADKNAIVARPDGADGAIVNYPIFDRKNVKELLFKGYITIDEKTKEETYNGWVRRGSKFFELDKLKYNYFLVKIKDSDNLILLTKTEAYNKFNKTEYDYQLQGINVKFQDSFSAENNTVTYSDPYIDMIQFFVNSETGKFLYADGRRYKLSTSGISLEFGGTSSAVLIDEFWGIL